MVIEPLLLRARSLKVWADEDSGASAWEVCYPQGSFFLMISPELYRGFSGEGQVLSALAKPPPEVVIAKVRASLKWQSQLDPDNLAAALGLNAGEVSGALAVLGSRGLAGFDANAQQYFHRELPFDLARVEAAAATFGQGLQTTLSAMLMSPYLLFRSELGAKTSAGDYALTPYEIASSLSYMITDSMPDDVVGLEALSAADRSVDKRERSAV